jgi:hypothetical protein
VHGLGGAVVPAGCAVGFVPRERMIGVVVRHVSRA